MDKKDYYKPGIKFYRKRMPADVIRILIAKQGEMKLLCKCQFSLEQTLYKLIRAAENIPLKTEK
jgi:hypothetical protein